MIEDADSSQMSALIDILKGNNMVVEGPPGTGKSQTITNLLAAAMAQGKSVLFIAEKQAALDVVKRRMDKAGLGDFCLDLHSDKVRKRLVLDSFKERMVNQKEHYNYSASDYNTQVQRYERAREKLQDYALMVNKNWQATGMTIHEIFTAAIRYGETVSPLSFDDIAPEGINGAHFNKMILDEELEKLERFYTYFDIVSQQLPEPDNWHSHPWYGVVNRKLVNISEDDIVQKLNTWTQAIENFFAAQQSFCQVNDIDMEAISSLSDLDQLIDKFEEIPHLAGNEAISCFKNIPDSALPSLLEANNHIKRIAEGFAKTGTIFHKDIVNDPSQLDKIKQSLQGLQELGVSHSPSFDDIIRAVTTAEEAQQLLNNMLTARDGLLPHINDKLQTIFSGDRQGLQELATFCEYAAELPAECLNQRAPLFDNEGLPEIIEKAETVSQQLLDQRASLQKTFSLDYLPDSKTLREIALEFESTSFIPFVSFIRGSWRNARKTAARFINYDKFGYKNMAAKLKDLAVWVDDKNELSENTEYGQALKENFRGMDTDWKKVRQLTGWYKKIRADYGIGFGRRAILASELFSLPVDLLRGVRSLYDDGIANHVSDFINKLEQLKKTFTLAKIFTDADIDYSEDADHFELFLTEAYSHLKGVQQSLVNANLPQAEVVTALESLSEIHQSIRAVDALNISKAYFNSELDLHFPLDGELPAGYPAFEETINYVSALYKMEFPALSEAILTFESTEDVTGLIEASKGLASDYRSLISVETDFFKLVDSNRDQWFKGSGDRIESAIMRNKTAAEDIASLDGWLKYLHARSRMETGGFGRLKEYLLQNKSTLEHAGEVMKFAVYQSLAEEIYQQKPELSEYSGHEQSALQAQFRKYDDKLKALQRRRVAHIASTVKVPEGTSGAKVTHYSEGYLLNHEIDKKSRHISIRNLVTRAGKAMQAYKPCFMMSPMAVTKYIPPGTLDFDLIVMDEASQVKPEYALSCFARGKNVVVVGDPKQLPPTTFFEKQVSNEEDDHEDTSVIDEAESILDAVGGHFKSRQLRWHYRSRHESLIEFSNHYFYDSSLIFFPSPWSQSNDYGIKFNYIEDGRLLNNVNPTESHAVVTAIKEHLIKHPDESLGVVAMNSKQRDQIESDLDSIMRNDAVLRRAYEENKETDDPLFIKNLENVQGDERDVVFISFTYGPKEKGSHHVPQRFGPINQEAGWRRLNVLFTRAKKRIQVYSSMTAGQILATGESSRGVHSLKAYLAYAETGRLEGQTGIQEKEPDSDFEIAVMNALSRQGFECVPQVGAAGFFIDLAVRDPGMPGRYLMGIECDGATYHSSKSTRDRDKVRQGVLEGQGWTIRRIWSTDWFKNPAAELKPIVEELKKMSTPVSKRPQEENKLLKIDTDNTDHTEIHSTADSSETPESFKMQSLDQRLSRFAANVIAQRFPGTAEDRRLLRPEMLERLVMEKPTSQEDFTVFIPGYLRTHTEPCEADTFLNDVLEIIAEYEDSCNDS